MLLDPEIFFSQKSAMISLGLPSPATTHRGGGEERSVPSQWPQWENIGDVWSRRSNKYNIYFSIFFESKILIVVNFNRWIRTRKMGRGEINILYPRYNWIMDRNSCHKDGNQLCVNISWWKQNISQDKSNYLFYPGNIKCCQSHKNLSVLLQY